MDNESIDNNNNSNQNASSSTESIDSATIKFNSKFTKLLNSDSTSNHPSVLVTHLTNSNNIIKANENYNTTTSSAVEHDNEPIDSNVEDECEAIEYEYDENEENSQLEGN